MIKVNLISVKKKKKRKAVPAVFMAMIAVIAATAAVLVYLVYFFGSRVTARQAQVKENEGKIAELKRKIKSVEDYEKLNTSFQRRKEIIEQLGKNKSVPVKILDEMSTTLPAGVWLTSLDVKGTTISLACTAFTNTDVVNYVNNLKASKLFADVFLLESVQASSAGFQLYNFKISMKVVV